MNIKIIPVCLLVILLNPAANAQIKRCGTELNDKQKNFELSFTDSVTSLFTFDRVINVTLFIVKDDEGETNVDMGEFNSAFAGVNNAFEKINLHFRISATRYIDNYHFDELKKGDNETDMVIQNIVANTINLYLVSKLLDADDQEVCGYTYYPAEAKDIILMNKSCISASLMTEQFGHFFNLYHTHEDGFASELVNGSNCSTAGDLCCDTPADPDLTGKVASDCQYESTFKDENNDYYIPSVYNYMSFSPDNCGKCYFSDEQYLRILNCLLKIKSHLW